MAKKTQKKNGKKKPLIGPRKGRKLGRRTKPGKLPSTKGFQVPEPEKKELTPIIGTVELLHEKVRHALYLRSLNWDLEEIGIQLGKEFQCETVPKSTVGDWINKYHAAADEDCKEFTNERRRQQDLILNNLLKRWLPVAMAEKFRVTRYRTVDGEVVPVIDENAYDEQTKAGAICIKLLERQSKLWNLDLTKADGEGKVVTEETLRLYIIQQLQLPQGTNGGAIDVESERVPVLELHAGEGDIDAI